MNGAQLEQVAREAGLLVEWEDAEGRMRRVAPETLRVVLERLGYPADTPQRLRESLARIGREREAAPPLRVLQAGARIALGPPHAAYEWEDECGERHGGRFDAEGAPSTALAPGYGRLRFGDTELALALAPARCHGPADALGAPRPRAWGLALQVYAVRGPHDAGIGDAGGVAAWAARAAQAGADAIALSPLHALADPARQPSPYSPSDRRFLNPLHAAPTRVLGETFALNGLNRAGLAETFASCQALHLVDWPRAAEAKLRWLRQLHADFASAEDRLQCDFATFCNASGASLRAFAGFAAASDGLDAGFHRFAQWLAARSWADLQAECRARGMRIGLIADLAVGFAPDGAEARAHRDCVLDGLTLGAPPDAFNAQGQVWGIAAFHPHALRRHGYAPWIELLRAAMRDRGGVRIDHILGVLRLWVVPEGGAPGEGVYLRNAFDDLLNLLALESWRHRCIVIGEDLGVVPDGLRAELARRGVLGLDVLPFTRDERGEFLPPERWRREAVATTTTHDLPPLAGWRAGHDLGWRYRLGQLDDDALVTQLEQRQRDIERLAYSVATALGGSGHEHADWLRFTARAPAPLALLPVEDALELDEQPNLPGTVDEHPNWRRRLPGLPPEAALRRNLEAFADGRRQTP
ncbi:4-alpha-glucanotransferase [Vulcaniibacterium thermophilum]|uniref:4-alpha-glucanotransferase n=1 Tax=Vulcaniibacterium thermophilum TaxID=1169913 RepID=A0A919DF20_9GAMM|nr:4-alpha-glucanotransferase [Vulcaniibacterium thermophilum]GHE42136.1 4-alpha-glucanotransferase [Vulcaniibacterium thermophilum]